jgi:hypothetical protein
MAQHSIVALTSETPVRLTPNGRHGGMDITLQNVNDSGYIYVGANDILSSSNYGFRILPNHSVSFELPSLDALYAIGSTSMNLAVMQTGLESQN